MFRSTRGMMSDAAGECHGDRDSSQSSRDPRLAGVGARSVHRRTRRGARCHTRPAAASWTLAGAGGAVSVTPGRVERPDLVLEMSPGTFVRMLAEITNPMVLMLTHKIRVKGFGKMGAFGKLFPTPQPERVLNLAIAPAVAVAGPSGRESSSDASG